MFKTFSEDFDVHVHCLSNHFPSLGQGQPGKGELFCTSELNSHFISKELDRVLKVQEVDVDKLANPPVDKIQVTWIGHATVLVQFDGISVLSDPVFLDYCGPTRWTSYKRYRKAACEIKDIKNLDAVVISHDHYDHLETSAVQEIAQQFPGVSWFVTLEQKKWLIKKGVNGDRIIELDWWADSQITLNGKQFRFACVPSQHWCARSPPIDQCKVCFMTPSH